MFFSFLFSSFLPGSHSEFNCRIQWKPIPFMQTFLKQQGYVWSQEQWCVRWKAGGDFSQARPRQGPPHHAVMKGRIKRPSQSQAPSDSPWLNIVHANKHHCEFAVCLLVDTLPLPSKFDACMDVFRSSWTLFDQLQSEANFLLYFKIWYSIVSAQHFR